MDKAHSYGAAKVAPSTGATAWVNVILAVALWPNGAWAEGRAAVLVTRGPGMERCPDSVALEGQLQALLGTRAADSRTKSYTVTFSRSGGLASATIRRDGENGQARVIESRAEECESLTRATTVILALLFDEDRIKNHSASPSAGASLSRDGRPPPRMGSNIDAVLSIGAAGVTGVIAPVAPALLGEIGIDGDRWRAGIGPLWIMPQVFDFDSGRVRESLLGLAVRACYVFNPSGRLHLDLCSGGIFGVIAGEASGYLQNGRGTQPWIAFPLEVGLFNDVGAVRFELSATGIVPIHADDFSLTGPGVAYRAPPIGSLFTLRISGLLHL
jgi:hypothetical protein